MWCIKKINSFLTTIFLGIVWIYQRTLSPDKGIPSLRLKGRVCMHEPHCSEYGKLCLQRYGFFHSIGKITHRVFSCTGGMHKIYDPEFYKVVFFSSAPIGVPFLEKLYRDPRFDVTGVVTMPDAPAGRGMKMQENIIKIKAKELFHDNKISKIIVLHGTKASPGYGRYPLFAADMKKHNIPTFIPKLPNSSDPLLDVRLQEIDKLQPDENTIIIGHSRGGAALLRWLEKLPQGKKVKKAILIAASDGHADAHEEGDSRGFYSDTGYDFTKIKQHCDEFVVLHSSDDERVDFSVGQEHAKGLDATFYQFQDKGHMGKNLAEQGLPELTEEILYTCGLRAIRYFLLIDSMQEGRQSVLRKHNITRLPYEDRGIVVYGNTDNYVEYTTILQKLLINGPWYLDTQGDKNSIIFKDKIFDLNLGESEQAKSYGRNIGVLEKQLDREPTVINNFIQTPNSLRLNSKKYADEAEQFQQWLTNKKPDFLVVIAYGKIIPQHILDIPTFGPINVHGSILPKYRGASPIQSVFLHDEKETGITIMKMDAGLDTGDMIDTAKFPIAFDRTAKDVINKMQDVGPQFLVDTLRNYGKGLLGEVKQDDAKATHCGKIEKEAGLIDPYVDGIKSVYQKYRAYILWPKIYFVHNGKRVIIEQLVIDEKLFAQHKQDPLIQNNITNPCIITLIVKPEGSKSQSRDDFVKGYM